MKDVTILNRIKLEKGEVVVDVHSPLGSYCGTFVYPESDVRFLTDHNEGSRKGYYFKVRQEDDQSRDKKNS